MCIWSYIYDFLNYLTNFVQAQFDEYFRKRFYWIYTMVFTRNSHTVYKWIRDFLGVSWLNSCGLFISLDSLLRDRTENGGGGLGDLDVVASVEESRSRSFVKYFIFSVAVKGLVNFSKSTRTIQVPSFPLTDTLASSLDFIHEALEILN